MGWIEWMHHSFTGVKNSNDEAAPVCTINTVQYTVQYCSI